MALTAYASVQDRMRAILAGFNTHVAKPVETNELVTVVASLAGRLGKIRPRAGIIASAPANANRRVAKAQRRKARLNCCHQNPFTITKTLPRCSR